MYRLPKVMYADFQIIPNNMHIYIRCSIYIHIYLCIYLESVNDRRNRRRRRNFGCSIKT